MSNVSKESYVEGFKSFRIQTLCIVNLVAVVVIVMLVVVVVHGLNASRVQVLRAYARFGLDRVVAS